MNKLERRVKMPSLDRIYLINAAGFDEVEFPVSGHCQVIGVNGHGKSTLLRTVLFFYLGVNDKSLYALDETKSDFVSHYLGNPPSYLIYEVSRGDNQPNFHIIVTRPAGRIQFHFVDAPYRRDYYLDSQLVLPIEDVLERWREAKCATETVFSYDDFNHRIRGVVSSPYAVFRPAARSAGQENVLPRIISGIFTVSQLEADKLKSALTCGVKGDGQTAELDLEQLKAQLTHFHRVNRAVTTYLRHEEDAADLVDLGESYETTKTERQRAVEELVRAAKCLPEEAQRLQEQSHGLQKEEEALKNAHAVETGGFAKKIKELGEKIAVLKENIEKAEAARNEYQSLEIEKKQKELESLQQLEQEKTLAEQEYESLTAKFTDETQRKKLLLAARSQSWSELQARFQERLAEIERNAREVSEQLSLEQETARRKIEVEQDAALEMLIPRRRKLDDERSTLNHQSSELAGIKQPAEILGTERQMKEADRRQNEEAKKQERLRSELVLMKERQATEREKLQREAVNERDRLSHQVDQLSTACGQTEQEIEAFDASLARFFQTQSPDGWPQAAKTLNRETLFTNAEELNVKSSLSAGAWGVKFSTEALPEPTQSYNRDQLVNSLRDTRKRLTEAKNDKLAAETRSLSDFDTFEKRASQTMNAKEAEITVCGEVRGKYAEEALLLENRLIDLRGRFEEMVQSRRDDLASREKEWSDTIDSLREEEATLKFTFRTQIKKLDEDFKSRKAVATHEQKEQQKILEGDQIEARRKHKDDIERIERESHERLASTGADVTVLTTVQKRAANAANEIKRISNFRDEVSIYRQKKEELIDRLPAWESERKAGEESQLAQQAALQQASARHQAAIKAIQNRCEQIKTAVEDVKKDEEAVERFRRDPRFVQELGYFERNDLPPAVFHQAGAVREHLNVAEGAHQNRESIAKRGEKQAKAFLNKFDAETLDRKVLGFSPIHEFFDWFIFVGNELKPFVTQRRIAGLKQTQTHQFEQLIRNICNRNAAFSAGIRQVRQTAESVQEHLNKNNFVDVLDSIELKIEPVDNQLTRILDGLEGFAGMSFGQDHDLFGKRPDQTQVDRAIEHFERLVKEIDRYPRKQLFLTDYFDFLIRVHENGRDMGWRKSLNHIGSTGTDYLIKMLVYLSLIEVYRARAMDPKAEATVHCVLDETGVLAPKYVRNVLTYAASRGIRLITAGHSQQTMGFENWMLVRKVGHRFAGQTVLRKILRCD